jgi:hypothetical protein
MVLAMLQKIEKYFKHKSGGIVVYKNNLKNHIKFKYLNNDLLLGCVYTLPENSLYSSINAFLNIENELVNFIERHEMCTYWRF